MHSELHIWKRRNIREGEVKDGNGDGDGKRWALRKYIDVFVYAVGYGSTQAECALSCR